MSLTTAQYNEIMQEYDRIRTENHHREMERRNEIYQLIPRIKEINEQITHLSVETSRFMLFHPDQDKRQELRIRTGKLANERARLLLANHYPANYLDPIYTCSRCKDTGYIGQDKCICLKQRYVDCLFNQSNLRHILREENFSTFRLDYYSDQPLSPGGVHKDSGSSKLPDLSPRDNMKSIYYECDQFIRTFKTNPGQNLLINGKTGRGKTFLTNCIAGEILRRENSVIYLTAYELFQELEDYTFHGKGRDGNLPSLLTCDLLIIDDLGTELTNSFVNTQLFHCINERIIGKKSTIINTNLSLELISETYTERVSSRIIQHYKLLHIYGEDIRMKKAFSSLDGSK